MSKKDYILIANTLNRLYDSKKITAKNKKFILDLAVNLAYEFKLKNKKFNTKKFLDIVT